MKNFHAPLKVGHEYEFIGNPGHAKTPWQCRFRKSISGNAKSYTHRSKLDITRGLLGFQAGISLQSKTAAEIAVPLTIPHGVGESSAVPLKIRAIKKAGYVRDFSQILERRLDHTTIHAQRSAIGRR